MARIFSKTRLFAASLLYGMAAGMPVHADDTEIYFSQTASQGTVKPNVLFVMDTSGSMDTAVSGTNKTRLQILKESLDQILQDMTNVNVGLMNFSGPDNSVANGGPVLYPVRDIDADASAPQVFQVGASGDDAVEVVSTGAVDLTQTAISAVTEAVACSGCSSDQRISAQTNNIETNSTTFSYATFGTDNIGLRYSLPIPQGATIVDAYVEITANNDQSSSGQSAFSEDLTLDVAVEDSNNAPAFVNGTNVSTRALTSTRVRTPTLPPLTVNQTYRFTGLEGLVQSIVNRSGWASGNNIAFRFIPASGTGKREAYSFSSNAARAPRLYVVWSDGTSRNNVVGIRFTGVQVPQGATINDARVEFTAATAGVGTALLTMQGEAADNSAAFTASANNLTSRTRTTAVTTWNVEDWTTAGESYQSADFRSVMQEVTNRSGWCGGNSFTLFLTGTGARRFLTYDNDGAKAPKLRVSFSATSGTGCVAKTAAAQISNNSDDATQKANTNGTVSNNDSSLVFTSGSGNTAAIGLRFRNIQVPANATITSATLTLTANASAGTGGSFTIYGVSDSDFGGFGTGNRAITNLTTLSNTVTWAPSAAWVSDRAYTSPDISTIVSQIVGLNGWATGNDLAFVIRPTAGSGYSAYSRNNNAAYAAKLTISYQGTYSGQTTRDVLRSLVSQFSADSWTPTSGVLLEAASYIKGEPVYFGKQRGNPGGGKFRTSHPLSYSGGTVNMPSNCSGRDSNNSNCASETITGSPRYISPITQACQNSFVVFLSDGEPNSNTTTTANLVQSLTGNTCSTNADGKDCSYKLAQFMSGTDMSSGTGGQPGTQTAKTYTIGFNLSSTFLRDLAETYGGGHYYEASNTTQLVDAFRTILNSVQAESSSFVTAGVSINQVNRITNRDELYFALFEPTLTVDWPGNLKKYRILNGQIVDVNNQPAVDVDGQFKDTARSFWSPAVDGNSVADGGAASQLTNTRTVYSNIVSNVLTATQNQVIGTNTNITAAMVGASTTTDRDDTLKWVRGEDVMATPSTTNARKRMGDPLHSRPVLIDYRNAGTVTSTIYMGSNEGYLHAVNSATGGENWAFIPRELMANLTTLRRNQVIDPRVYGLDGPVNIYLVDNNGDGVIDVGSDHAYLYVGMRRGGRSYYALDISNPTAPTLMFSITGGVTTGFDELGQTFSAPIITKVKFNNVTRTVMIFGGGYDATNGDYAGTTDVNGNVTGVPRDDAVGRNIYMVDALTGAKLWDARTSAVNGRTTPTLTSLMTNSFPGNVRAISLRTDGLLEHLYAADTRGQIFRFDINQSNTGVSDFASGIRFAHIQPDVNYDADTTNNSAAGNRRFFNEPSVSLIRLDSGESVVAVSIGSGYREHPLNDATQDHFYSIRDYGVLSNTVEDDIALADLQDITDFTGDTTSNGVAGSGGNGVSDAVEAIARNNKKGWYLRLTGLGTNAQGQTTTQAGEKVLTSALTFDNSVLFTTYLPTTGASNACAPTIGSNRTYFVDLFGGDARNNYEPGQVDSSYSATDRFTQNLRGGLGTDSQLLFTEDSSGNLRVQELQGNELRSTVGLGARLQMKKWRHLTTDHQ